MLNSISRIQPSGPLMKERCIREAFHTNTTNAVKGRAKREGPNAYSLIANIQKIYVKNDSMLKYL